MTALISRGPCDYCEDRRTVYDPAPSDLCMRSPSGELECDAMLAVDELTAKAVASAEHWQHKIRHTPADVRHDAIENEAGVYEEWAAELGAAFDSAAWVTLCGVSVTA